MYFTDQKITTQRTAVAEGIIRMDPKTLLQIRNKTVPKGDVIEMARAAGTMAAKKTPELIPFCHPLPIDGIRIDFELKENEIRIQSTVSVIWKTGVEMEALVAVNIAALTIYDMLKPLDSNMEIDSIRLMEKRGGKSDYVEDIPPDFKAAVIVTSDGTFQGKREDKSGKIIKAKLESFGIRAISYVVLPDEKEQIKNELLKLAQKEINLVVTTGGTGLGPRDVTVDATKEIIEKEVPGIAEAMRQFGQSRTPYAMLSRGLAGFCGKTLILNLPGSSRGSEESMNAVFPAVLHIYKMMRGGGH